MSPKVIEEFSDLPYFFVQTKYDGSFGYLEAAADGAKLFTRAGSFYPSWLANKLAECVQNGTVVMGEVLVFRLGKPLSRKESNGILNSLLQGGEPKSEDDFRMIAWDIVSKADFLLGKCDDVYALRLQDAERTFYGNNLTLAKTTVVMNVSEAFALNREAMLRGEEGTVWKKPAGVWRDSSSGTRDAVKVKLVFEAEYKVEGKYEGDGKAKGMLGGFNIATSDGLIKSNVGSGFSDKQRKEFWEADTTDWIITVEANDVISKSGSDTESLFLPIFSERRLDKKVADTRERVLAQLQAAKLGEKLD
jgi:ATP-dependent DNA ligase